MNNSAYKRHTAAEHNAKTALEKHDERMLRERVERACTRPRWPFIAAGAAF